MNRLTPTIPDVFEDQLPTYVNTNNNQRFVALLRHYYNWLTEKGQPTEFIHNLLSYRDIDLTSDKFRHHLAASLYHAIPANSAVDPNLIAKHITEFLKAKGSLESFEFIMNAIYGEDITIDWNSNKLLRPSTNKFERAATVVIESTNPWEDVETVKLEQYEPTQASAIINSCVSTTFNGKTLNWLQLDDSSITGTFVPNSQVRALHKTIDRSWYQVKEYYTPISYKNNLLTFHAITEENRPYEGLVVKQLGSDFRAIVESFVSRISTNGLQSNITVKLKDATGTLSDGEIYFLVSYIEATTYTKDDYEFGVVSKSIGNIKLTNPGSMYQPGDKISFIGGNGVGAEGYISEITGGPITEVDIIAKGYGYAVGDSLTVADLNTAGSGFQAEVSAIDGIDGKLNLISELNDFAIVDGGYDYHVGDTIELAGGAVLSGTQSAILTVSSVDSTWLFRGVKVDAPGRNYPNYSKLALINSSTLAPISGFAATFTRNFRNGISSVTVTSVPTINTDALKIIANGYGASYTATITGGSITSATPINTGINYVHPTVSVLGDGHGAVLTPVLDSDGRIASLTITKSGTGYTTATILISDVGDGFSATPLFNNQTAATGSITGLTITTRGKYTTLPSCFNHTPKTLTGVGHSAIFNFDFRLKSVEIDTPGNYYHSVSTSVTGQGTGAILKGDLRDGVLTASSFSKTSGGTGYTYANVFISGGIGFIGTANIIGGAVDSITLIDGGYGYGVSSIVTIIGDGSGALYSISGVDDGVLKAISVIDGGANYYHGTTINAPTSQGGAIPASLTPTIVDGVIKSVLVSAGNKGYIPADLDNITISAGTPPEITTTSSGTGKVVKADLPNAGHGYRSLEEVPPINITASDGIGAVLMPVLTADGSFDRIEVFYGGSGYLIGSTISITGGLGSGATADPVVVDGIITSVTITNPGTGYSYGTKLHVIGNGVNAELTPIVETGITLAEVLAGGEHYTNQNTIIVTDPDRITTPAPVDAIIRPIIENGKILALEILESGTGYVSPSLSVNTSTGFGATLVAQAKRHIKSVTIANPGSGYTYGDVIVVGDGADADITVSLDKLGSLDAATISVAGSGITSTPSAVLVDDSGYGAVSRVKITNVGNGYRMPPILYLPTKYDVLGNIIATGAKFACYGKKVGAVSKIEFTNHGASYEDLPTPIFPIVARLSKNAPFKLGETVTISNARFDVGRSAKVLDFDYNRNIIKLDASADIFWINTEKNRRIISENGFAFVSETSGSFDVGDEIVGSKSGAVATIMTLDRANGIATVGGNGWGEYKFADEVGKLNEKTSVLADNFRYQDYAYVVKAGRALKTYEELLKKTVHPAGFSLFGDLVTQTMTESGILNDIGFNRLVTIIFILSVYNLIRGSSEWSNLDSLYGDSAKFKFDHLSIEEVKDLNFLQTSERIFMTHDGYYAASAASEPLGPSGFSGWTLQEQLNYIDTVINPNFTAPLSAYTIFNSASIATNAESGPNKESTMVRISDSSTLSISRLEWSFSTVVGHRYSVELFVRKEVNPFTFPRFQIVDGAAYPYVNLHTEKGFIRGNIEVEKIDLGDFWYLRIFRTASTTTMVFRIFPALNSISQFAQGTSDVSVTGAILISTPIIRDITGMVKSIEFLYADNDSYIGTKLPILSLETYRVQS